MHQLSCESQKKEFSRHLLKLHHKSQEGTFFVVLLHNINLCRYRVNQNTTVAWAELQRMRFAVYADGKERFGLRNESFSSLIKNTLRMILRNNWSRIRLDTILEMMRIPSSVVFWHLFGPLGGLTLQCNLSHLCKSYTWLILIFNCGIIILPQLYIGIMIYVYLSGVNMFLKSI